MAEKKDAEDYKGFLNAGAVRQMVKAAGLDLEEVVATDIEVLGDGTFIYTVYDRAFYKTTGVFREIRKTANVPAGPWTE